ncbi:hypothetical protein LTR99_010553 [Exophiala xenobiotica]|uniref:Uncharacterized protein n=1 Tax=Vermiconidia calcicola TaxID=1690605 RepID=A0AAV9PW27_9PEZI|nr:hypothetical protein LTR92_007493 [Exophiala xenobiotica]KAK5528710.1 hypothetical protein LTR25_010323 [Vermiconidia calcicola]KAK5546134.1 hypothetical protein LTR23_003941 [Chaetothyriales sp. CCFEE 6169]KAK5207668.1 hypothetical protein LTR41_006712 [Exophiala xenobiotica]KAK5220693.1 hypothetical protein LTR72_007315 [Exophiala xenobiotica]
MATSEANTPTATSKQLPAQKQDTPRSSGNTNKTSNSGPSYCAYHNPILNLRPPVEQPRRYGTMDRFLQEGPADQSAIFNRPDNGVVSISKGCTCLKNGENKAGRL